MSAIFTINGYWSWKLDVEQSEENDGNDSGIESGKKLLKLRKFWVNFNSNS